MGYPPVVEQRKPLKMGFLLEKEIPIGNHHLLGAMSMLVFGSVVQRNELFSHEDQTFDDLMFRQPNSWPLLVVDAQPPFF